MKKLLSVILVFVLLMSVACISYTGKILAETGELNEKLTDTSDFSLSSIELTENMLIGYNIGNSFEMTELRQNYSRPENIDDFVKYKETMAGNVQITEQYIKYLRSIGVQAIRLPVTWFNALEINGKIVSKDTYYKGLSERRNFWYNGTINAEFMARVKQVVNWIIDNDMYCILNSHHDGVYNNASSPNPVKFGTVEQEGETYNQQAIKFLTNIWSQIGEEFKDYGSKLLFEPYNEVADPTNQTPEAERDKCAAEVMRCFIKQIRAQGSNNAERFIVSPAYTGVKFWDNIDDFKDADTAEDKLIITTHTYLKSSSLYNSVKSVRTRMTNLGIGAIVDEIGNLSTSSISDDQILAAQNIRKASDEYKVSCFWWDNGEGDCSIINRFYNQPSSDALSAFVGKNLERKTYTKNEALALTSATQPNWVNLYTEDVNSDWAGKHLLIVSENKIKTLDESKSSISQGYYTINGAEEGLLTYFTSDDGENYKLMHTVIPTNWAKIAWDMFKVYGSSYYTRQTDGNYKIEKIGDGLQNYIATGENLINKGGNWQNGQYSINNGAYEGIGSSYYSTRICMENKISVVPNQYYIFKLTEDSSTRYQFVIRAYDESGNFVKSIGTITNGALLMPQNAYQISITLYDSHQSDNAETLYKYLDSGVLNPSIYHYVESSSEVDPTEPTNPSSSSSSVTQPSTQGSDPLDASVAMITETGNKYQTFEAAFNACKSGETVKILKDCSSPYLGGNVSHVERRTIDLNGHALTCTDSRFISPGSGTGNWSVTVKNGTITNEGKLNFESYVMVRANSSVTFENVTIYDYAESRPNGYGFIGTITDSTGVINFRNCKIYQSGVNIVQGYNTAGSTVNFYNTIVESATPIFYANSTYNVYSGTFTATGDKNLGTYVVAAHSKAIVKQVKRVVVECNHNYTKGVCEYCGENQPAVDLTVKMTMEKGASIRLNNINGIRFYTKVDKEKIAQLRAERYTVEIGTLIAPKDLLGKDELTFEIEENKYINVPYTADKYYENSNMNFSGVVGSIIKIKENNTSFSLESGNITREFVGRGYVKVTSNDQVKISYASYYDDNMTNNSRSLAFVSNALKNDTNAYNKISEQNQIIVDNWAKYYANSSNGEDLGNIYNLDADSIVENLGQPAYQRFSNYTYADYARSIRSMTVVDGKVLLGCGEYQHNSGATTDPVSGEANAGTPIYYFTNDSATPKNSSYLNGTTVKQGLSTESVERFFNIDGTVYAVATDPLGEWAAHYYRFNSSTAQWDFYEAALPAGEHAYDMIEYDGKIFFADMILNLNNDDPDFSGVRKVVIGVMNVFDKSKLGTSERASKRVPFETNNPSYPMKKDNGKYGHTSNYYRSYDLFIYKDELYATHFTNTSNSLATIANGTLPYDGLYKYDKTQEKFIQLQDGSKKKGMAAVLRNRSFGSKHFSFEDNSAIQEPLRIGNEAIYGSDFQLQAKISTDNCFIAVYNGIFKSTDMDTFEQVFLGSQYNDYVIRNAFEHNGKYYFLGSKMNEFNKSYTNAVFETDSNFSTFKKVLSFDSEAFATSFAYNDGYMYFGTGCYDTNTSNVEQVSNPASGTVYRIKLRK